MSLLSAPAERRKLPRPGTLSAATKAGLLAFTSWRARRADRAALRRLSDRTLKDLGLDRSEITSVVDGRGRDISRRRRGPWRWIRFS